MRILKKSLALLVALTMLASLVVVNVSATEDTKVYIGSESVLSLAQEQQVTIPVFVKTTDDTSVYGIICLLDYDTDVLTLDDIVLKAAGLTDMSSEVDKKIAGLDFMGNNHEYTYDDADVTDDAAANLALLTFTVAANAEAGDYVISGTLDANNTKHKGDSGNVSVADQFTVVEGKITVIEEQWISSTEEVELGDIEYGADEPELPQTVKGAGQTSNGETIDGTDNVELDVEWGAVDTFRTPENNLILTGTVTTEEDDILKYKNTAGEPIDAPAATAKYNIVKSTKGDVAPVAIEVEARFGGEATGVADIVELAEVAAVTTTTIKLANDAAQQETVTLDWESATPADATLNLVTPEASVELNVPVIPLTGDTTYYDLEGKFAVVTITVQPAVKMYNVIEAVTVETEVEYGAENELVLPETVKGKGKTKGGQEITEENSDDLPVVWGTIDTLQTPGAKTVNGTVAKPASDTIEFKNNDYTADVESLTAVAKYTVKKSTAGTVAPVADIEVRAKEAGAGTDIEGIVALPEVAAVTTTTIKLANDAAAEETVKLDWAGAIAANAEDTTLDLTSDSDSIELIVPVTAVGDDTTYYNLDGKTVKVTIQMTPAWDYGDVNHSGGDNPVTFDDAVLTAKYAVSGSVSGTFDAVLANVDGNDAGQNGVTFDDAIEIAKKAVSPSYKFPIELPVEQ